MKEKLHQPVITHVKKYLVMNFPRRLRGFINLTIDILKIVRMMENKQYSV